ncbi:BolA family protein [Tepidimonas charontis]|uniref:DNA-binding transcriptional regulator BolA n=1 Tax=Tepidimonas charontis TaxID=2267262 RepID=A0A554XEG9_9BURK|nr:BolA/IbaG family iron-sulfur metabolism protein [Tepidimonas charontis]TSE34232.1 DNA-binding transcriptional regulator BolA [Tepidimonas charontis]
MNDHAPTTSEAGPTAAWIETLLRQALQPTQLHVIDESAAHAGHAGANALGQGTHFRIRIAAAALRGRSRVAAHRLVYDALRPAFQAGLHALAIEVLPPE